jgi:hypothetical protein
MDFVSLVTENNACFVDWPEKITCESNKILDLKQEFLNISGFLEDDRKKFQYFYLKAPIDELKENVFIDIKFINIKIDSNIIRIHSNAFKSTAMYTFSYEDTSHFNSRLRNSPPDYDLYAAFSSLIKAESIQIILDHNFKNEIPDYAFKKINIPQIALEEIVFEGDISKIGNYAFWELTNLRFLGFNVKSVEFITSHAFDFKFSHVNINLNMTQLNEGCFETGIFSSALYNPNLNLSNVVLYFESLKLNF